MALIVEESVAAFNSLACESSLCSQLSSELSELASNDSLGDAALV